MSKQQVVNPNRKTATGAYSDGIIAGGFLYVSGQAGIDLVTGKIIPGTIEEQTRMTLSHIETVLKAGGCTREDVIKCTVHLADINDFQRFNQVYGEFFTGVRPARTTVQSVLPPNMKIEIDAIAKVPNS
ncbi:MAG: regulator [Phycisphaeraceae bacterium]|nr:regulator [Phycisphaeraceae bacterium]